MFVIEQGMIIMKNLKILRQQHGISQEKLAEQIHTTQQAIYKYESGISQPDLSRIMELSDFFHTSVDYLIGHTDDPRPFPDLVPTNLSQEEISVIEVYRILPHDIQSHFFSLMQSYHSLLANRLAERKNVDK